ncbi:chemotaxis protein [Pueribacillus theae]|uniref:Chemotaxis protein n=1 Tax=Pueribacillus theae TaxID=2171751 RepID=A0A2U1JZA8_9BACI|nr:methyl-accepting chemotaxis protein [Pueribacillus theae]PWA10103.1 chemotaxis protein [Pueribacillus theae]
MKLFMPKSKTWNEYINDSRGAEIVEVGDRIKDRLVFMGIDQETLKNIRNAYPILSPYKAEIVNKFYERITSVDHLKGIIIQHSTIDRLRKTMEKYLDQFLHAEVNKDYVKTRIIIGEVHSRIHLTAEHFISAHHLLIQSMTLILMEKLHNQPNRMMEAVFSIQKLAAFDQQLIVEVYMEETFKSFLFGISDTLHYTTQLDTSRQLISEMDNMNGESFSVSSATQEVSASILEVANHSIKVAEGTDEAVQSAEQSKEVVNEALQDIQKVGNVYEQVTEQVNKLHNEIDKTHEIVGIIRQITEQTNLLALNASIEAARAGEHGKGFAVVANEVRKLAEHTKEQTLQISANMKSLQEVSNLVTRQMSDTGKLIEKSVTGARVADEAINKIVHAMQNINQSTSQIAAMSEEQTSAVDEIAQRNSVIFELSNSSQEIAKQTAKVIFDLSKQMEEYRNTFFATNIRLTAKDVIKVAKTDHLLWKWKVYNMLLGLETIDPEQIASHESCRLGKWYYSNLPSSVKSKPAFQQLEKPHKDVHLYAVQAAKCYEKGDLSGAQEAFGLLQDSSEIVVTLLSKIESEV